MPHCDFDTRMYTINDVIIKHIAYSWEEKISGKTESPISHDMVISSYSHTIILFEKVPRMTY